MKTDKCWLDELKVGDPVYVYHAYCDCRSYKLSKVEGITPKGYIRVNGLLYKPTDGTLRGGSLPYALDSIEDYNDPDNKAMYEKYRRATFVEKTLSRLERSKMTYEQAVVITEFMGWEVEV